VLDIKVAYITMITLNWCVIRYVNMFYNHLQVKYLPVIVFKCLKSPDHQLKMHGMRAVLHLLFYRSSSTVNELLRFVQYRFLWSL